MLKALELIDVGPAPRMRIDLCPRLNILTGDNGLGKSLFLDVAWWALTRTWANKQAWPARSRREILAVEEGPVIHYEVVGKTHRTVNRSSKFDFRRQTWPVPVGHPPVVGLVLYARVDGGFAVWDPVRNFGRDQDDPRFSGPRRPDAFLFNAQEVWDGIPGDPPICNGLIRDWTYWQAQSPSGNIGPERLRALLATLTPVHEKWVRSHLPRLEDVTSLDLERVGILPPFGLLTNVLHTLSPHEEQEWMKPGEPTHVGLDSRDIPTIETPYGVVPVTQASAGMMRILGLSYLLVWSYFYHVRAALDARTDPAEQIILLMDEVETHLHPQWQRRILPALLKVVEILRQSIHVQIIATTHAPLVLASLESHFDEKRDGLFLFDHEDGKVALNQVPWAKQGDVLNWLVSPVFNLRQGRSIEAEKAIAAADAFMRGDRQALPEGMRTRKQIHNRLKQLLPANDVFWPRWLVSAHGEEA